MTLRPYQVNAKSEIYKWWDSGIRRVLLVKATGMGKTKTFCSVTIDMAVVDEIVCRVKEAGKLPTAIMVHRKELLQQISLTLAEEGVVHNIIAQPHTIKGIIAAQRQVTGRQFYNYNASVTVVSVDTLNSRAAIHAAWAKRVRLVIIDEAAHVLEDNKWGRAVKLFDNALVLGVTATPSRLDKKGLGTPELGGEGIFEKIVLGPSSRYGIEEGYLADFKVAIPQSDYEDHLSLPTGGGDFSNQSMIKASKESKITGDVVDNYKKYADGLQAIVFATDVDTAHTMQEKFEAAGVKAVTLTGETPDQERLNGLIAFRKREIKVLINVDLFDEGLDVPGIDVVIMARPTMSLGKYLQMVGRALRPVYANGYDLSTKEGRLAAQAAGPKPYALIIDHVGNVKRHGSPKRVRNWTLASTKGQRKQNLELMRRCTNPMCDSHYERLLTECPFCGTPAITPSRDGSGRIPPAQVDGDLVLLDSKTLEELEAKTKLESPQDIYQRVAAVAGHAAGVRASKNQEERISYQQILADHIAQWAGKLREQGYNDRNIHKEFFILFDKTIPDALSEPKADMIKTMEKLEL